MNVGRIQQSWGILAVATLSQVAFANEEPPPQPALPQTPEPSLAQTTEPSLSPTPEASETPPAPKLQRALGPRVIWAAPGTAPPRPELTPRVASQSEPRASSFDVSSKRVLIGLERASSVASYRVSVSPPKGSDAVTSGVEASIIGRTEGEPTTPLVMPRLSVDARLTDVMSLGLSFSYAAHSAERDSSTQQRALPANESLLIGPRLGWFRPVSDKVAFWVRGGPTWARRASSAPTGEQDQQRYLTEQQWALSFEPQVLVMPLSHIGFSFGAAIDMGVSGEAKVSYGGGAIQPPTRSAMVASTYGFTAGLVAMF